MIGKKTTFAVMFGNRGFFPSSLQTAARAEITQTLKKLGHEVIMLPEETTKHGAIETVAEGRLFANFLRENKGKYGGVILSLPNFGDELGAAAALRDVDVPVFIQAYPDEMDKLAPAYRRDSFCGKFALCDVLLQHNIKFTVQSPHVVSPADAEFVANIDYFDKLCRVVNNLTNMTLLSIGARTTPFKSVRTDELALQKHKISVETLDMASIIGQTRQVDTNSKAFSQKSQLLKDSKMDFADMPDANFTNLCKLAIVLDETIQEYSADAIAIRCWIELQQQLNISPCFLNAMLCDRGIPAACEVDISNAVMMFALQSASNSPATILDWNNNYGKEPNKCIVFHCGNVPPSMLQTGTKIIEHAILAETAGKDCSWGCNCSRIRPMDITFGSLLTVDGKIKAFLGSGKITNDAIPADFFGCAGVAEIQNLQTTLKTLCLTGHRHHVSLCQGTVIEPIVEAFQRYLDIEVDQV